VEDEMLARGAEMVQDEERSVSVERRSTEGSKKHAADGGHTFVSRANPVENAQMPANWIEGYGKWMAFELSWGPT